MSKKDEIGRVGVIILAGSPRPKGAREKGGKGRKRAWAAYRERLGMSIASVINMDDYVIGENKSLLPLHPVLVSKMNMEYLKEVLRSSKGSPHREHLRTRERLLSYLGREGAAPISRVLTAVRECSSIDHDHVYIVGPARSLRKALGKEGSSSITIIEQGDSLGENVLLGKVNAASRGYSGKWLLMLAGDTPFITPGIIDRFLEGCRSAGGDHDILFGMGSRRQLKTYIRSRGLVERGKVGKNLPGKGNLNKFGLPFLDDRAIFGRKMARDNFMMGNIFLFRTGSVTRDFVDRFYSLRKMGANPLTFPRLVSMFGLPLIKAALWKLTLSEAETTFSRVSGTDLKVVPVPPKMVLDIDSFSDLGRACAAIFGTSGKAPDLRSIFEEGRQKVH